MSAEGRVPEQPGAVRLAGLRRGEPVQVEVDGRAVLAYEGETVATVLLVAGKRAFSHADNGDLASRLFCGMGLCHQCLVTVDDVWNVRACMTRVRPGMRIETRSPLGVS